MGILGRRDVLALSGMGALLAQVGRAEQAGPPASPASRRAELYDLMGDLPDRHRPIGGRKLREDERDGYVLETWELDLNGIEAVPAYVARPRTLAGRAPAMIFNHSHGGGYTIGKKEFVDGRSYLQPVPYQRPSPTWGTSLWPSIIGYSASAATPPKATCSRPCCGGARCSGA